MKIDERKRKEIMRSFIGPGGPDHPWTLLGFEVAFIIKKIATFAKKVTYFAGRRFICGTAAKFIGRALN